MLDLKKLAPSGYTISPAFLESLGGDHEGMEYVRRLIDHAHRPGDQVRLKQELISRLIAQFSAKPEMAEYVGVLQALENVGENRRSIEHVHVDGDGSLLYTFVGSDLKIEASFCTYPRPFIHEYGVLTLQADRLWFVHIDDETSEVRHVFELTQEPGRAARQQLSAESLTELVDLLKTEPDQAMAGEFAVEDHGAESWGLLYTSWSSGASEQILDQAIRAIQEAVSAHPAFN